MTIYLAQAVAGQEVALGPFLDDTDGKTQETGLSIANTDIKLWKAGATALVNKNSGGATHMANGVYYITLDATDTSAGGPLVIFCHKAGALPVRTECHVGHVDANVREFLGGGTDSAVAVIGALTAKHRVADLTSFAHTTTVFRVDFNPAYTGGMNIDDYFNGWLVAWPYGYHEERSLVTDYVAATKQFTISPPLATAPNFGQMVVLIPPLHPDAITAASIATGAVAKIQSGLALDSTVAKDATVAKAAALQAVDDLVDDLETRLTAARAGYLDNLNSGVTLTAGAIDAIVDEVIEGSTTLRQALRLILATAAGKSSGGGTSTVTFRDMADSKNRISASVDANGNRTSVTRDAS